MDNKVHKLLTICRRNISLYIIVFRALLFLVTISIKKKQSSNLYQFCNLSTNRNGGHNGALSDRVITRLLLIILSTQICTFLLT